MSELFYDRKKIRDYSPDRSWLPCLTAGRHVARIAGAGL